MDKNISMHTVWNNIKWLIVGQLTSRLIKSAVVIIAARALGTELFGSFNLALGIAATFMLLNDWGLDMLLLREIAKEETKNPQYLAALFITKVGLLFISIIALFLVGPLLASSPLVKHLLLILGISSLFDTLRDFHLSFARGKNRMDIDAGNQIIVNSIIFLISAASLFLYPSVFLLAYAYLLGSFVGLFITLFDVKTYYHSLKLHYSRSMLKRVAREGLPLGLATACITILLYADTIIIGTLRDAASVGLYAAPMKIIQLLYVGAGLLATAYFPLLSNHASLSRKTFMTTIHSFLRTSILASISIVIFFFSTAPYVIPLLFGNAYTSSIHVFQILLWSIPFVYISTTLGHILLVRNHQNKMVPFLIIGTSVNLLLNFIFIGKLGIEGAAMANVISQIINFIGYYIVYTKYITNSYEHIT
ncbi:MAG: flippase [Parcubacteria group bacterium]|nr:flippase [Parcubacteria group bacterium]